MLRAAARSKTNYGNNNSVYSLSATQRQAGVTKIIEARDRVCLKKDYGSFKLVGYDKGSNTPGNDKATTTTIERYDNHWKGLKDFCIEIGDYESAIILCPDLCPSDPPPVKLETANLFLRFKCMGSNDDDADDDGPLVYPRSRQPVISMLTKQPMYRRTDWASESTLKQYASALAKIHGHYETTKQEHYLEKCPQCAAIPIEDQRRGIACAHHLGQPQYRARGCATKDKSFKDNLAQAITFVRNTGSPRKSFSFIPRELRAIRRYLLSMNTEYHLMLWTITICGVRQFLRIDEDLTLTMDHFQPHYFQVHDSGHVDSLAMKIKGKRDIDWVFLKMWADNECPDLCPVRALLIWLAVSKIEDGFIFPPRVDIGKQHKQTRHLEKEHFREEIVFLCTRVLGKDMDSELMKKFIFGTHMLRRTAYLVAYWGWRGLSTNEKEDPPDIENANIASSARHSNVQSSLTYIGDAGALLEHFKRERDNNLLLDNKVGLWKPIYIEQLSMFESLTNKQIKTLPQVAREYVDKVLRVSVGRVTHFVLFQHAVRDQQSLSSTTDVGEEINEYLKKHMPAEVAKMTMQLMQKQMEQSVSRALDEQATRMQELESTVEELTDDQGSTPNKKRKQSPPVVSPQNESPPQEPVAWQQTNYQELIPATKNPAAKLDCIIDAVACVRTQLEEGKVLKNSVNGGMRRFVHRIAKIADCVEKCYGGDKQRFLSGNPKIAPSLFKCQHGQQHHFQGDAE